MTKEEKETYIQFSKKLGKAAGYLCLLFVPVFSYVLFEYVTGNLGGIHIYMAVLNVCWIYALYLLVFACSGSTRITVPLVSAALLILALAETFVVAFRDRPIMLWDVLAFRTAMTVSGNYQFAVTREMLQAIGAAASMNLVLWFVPVRIKGLKGRLVNGCCCLGLVIAYSLVFFKAVVPDWQLGINMWSVNETYEEYGYILSTAVSFQYVVKKPPAGYSHGRINEIYRRYSDVNEPPVETEADELAYEAEFQSADEGLPGKVQPVNLICIMNESLSDLQTAGAFSTNEAYFPFMDSLQENTVKGNLCMPVFGSMTSNSEFEFLTGDSMAMLPANSIAYQFNVKPDTYSLVSTVKSQGYHTVAMHPYPGENWNRDSCYDNMGFDEFLEGDYYEGREELRNYVSDQADFEALIDVVEQKENPEDKLFLFNVTMQNHGGYEGTYDNFEQEVYLTGELQGKYPKADQYLSLMKRSDEAFEYLLDYFSQSSQPTMIVMFGDHQPSVEDGFFDEIAGQASADVAVPDRLMWYETPFVVWTNYEQPAKELGKLGAVYLSSYVLKLANLEMTPYNRFLLDLSQVLPVAHFLGCYESDGTYYSWPKAESDDCPYKSMVLDYEALVYNHSLDRKKIKEMFSLNIK